MKQFFTIILLLSAFCVAQNPKPTDHGWDQMWDNTRTPAISHEFRSAAVHFIGAVERYACLLCPGSKDDEARDYRRADEEMQLAATSADEKRLLALMERYMRFAERGSAWHSGAIKTCRAEAKAALDAGHYSADDVRASKCLDKKQKDKLLEAN